MDDTSKDDSLNEWSLLQALVSWTVGHCSVEDNGRGPARLLSILKSTRQEKAAVGRTCPAYD